MKIYYFIITISILSSCSKESALIVNIPPEDASYAMIIGSLENNLPKDLLFEDLSSNVSEYTELHENIGSENEMMMRKVRAFELAPKETLNLNHGGKHIMLINLNQSLKVGDTFEVVIPDKTKKKHAFKVTVKDMHH